MLCGRCYGSKKVLGNGMMMEKCICTYPVPDSSSDESSDGLDRRSKSYRNAIKALMQFHNCSRDEAVKIYDEE